MSMDRRLPAGSVTRFDPPRPLRYTMPDLERESGIPARTIRYYIAEGLLQPAYGRGPTATYDSDHLLRLRFIQYLKNERLSLSDIQERLSTLTPDDIATALKVELEPSAEPWRHYALHDDLQIMVRDHSVSRRDPAREQAFGLIVDYARSVLDDLERRAHG